MSTGARKLDFKITRMDRAEFFLLAGQDRLNSRTVVVTVLLGVVQSRHLEGEGRVGQVQ